MHLSWNTSRTKPDVNQLNKIIFGPKNSIRSRNDAEKFLLTDKNSGQYTNRFISWMVALNILQSDIQKWAKYICQLCSKYESFMNSEMGSDPLLSLTNDQETQIQNDLRRAVRFFNDLAKSAKLPYSKQNGAIFCAARILTMINLTEPKYQYIQGCERYVFICYLVCLLFTVEHNLPNIIAESCAYYLATKMIELSGISHYLSDPSKLEKHFNELDQKLLAANPALMQKFMRTMQTSIHFALRWEILLFAEEHDYPGIISIWDRVIVHKENLHKYVEALCLAHFAQAPDCKLNQLQHYKGWDMDRLLSDADRFLEPERQQNYSTWKKASLLLLAAGAVSLVKLFHM